MQIGSDLKDPVLPMILCMRTNQKNITVTVRTLTKDYEEINRSKEKSFPNLSITFGKVFCLSSIIHNLTIMPCDYWAIIFFMQNENHCQTRKDHEEHRAFEE